MNELVLTVTVLVEQLLALSVSAQYYLYEEHKEKLFLLELQLKITLHGQNIGTMFLTVTVAALRSSVEQDRVVQNVDRL